MALHIVKNNNVEYNDDVVTCQTHCELFDQRTGKCGFFNNEVPYDPFYTANCTEYLSSEAWEEMKEVIDSQDEDNQINDQINDKLLYPASPDIDITDNYPAAVWYTSPENTFGCWIISTKKKRLMNVNSIGSGYTVNKEVYKSPYPMHDHGYRSYQASTIIWYIDDTGLGQYGYIDNGKIHLFNN